MIIKLQRPLDDPTHPWLIYDEPRVMIASISSERIPLEVLDAMDSDLKAYFDIEVQGYKITWKGRVADQPW